MNRRQFISAIPAVAVASALPAAAGVVGMSREERIQHHAEALMELIRDEFPDGATSIAIAVSADWGPADYLRHKPKVSARASEVVWSGDDRLKNGGLWVESGLGHWAPGIGLY